MMIMVRVWYCPSVCLGPPSQDVVGPNSSSRSLQVDSSIRRIGKLEKKRQMLHADNSPNVGPNNIMRGKPFFPFLYRYI